MSRFSKVQTPERHKKRKCTDGRGRKRGKGYGGNPGAVLRPYANAYQQYMKQLPIPSKRCETHIPNITWRELGNSMKQLYGQPLHYLTNLMLQRWDDSRIGSENEHRPMHSIIEPSVAESTIWVVEEFHRRSTSAQHVATLWINDPKYSAFIDPIPHTGGCSDAKSAENTDSCII
ncbi:hypothetical protein VitviT2T_019233 [Vitis vinifera]|uniref:Protein RDM1 n=1 Tax=Vitis vinifera TaxID=29760 RepID=A0ABY9D2F7_VITVI|nr:hypothetical protein VitviT2T_019233 [Vitis vinifera]|eukprot:XP_019080175.1 PREDICTED: protein RDM1-like [Vitis vinifera]